MSGFKAPVLYSHNCLLAMPTPLCSLTQWFGAIHCLSLGLSFLIYKMSMLLASFRI